MMLNQYRGNPIFVELYPHVFYLCDVCYFSKCVCVYALCIMTPILKSLFKVQPYYVCWNPSTKLIRYALPHHPNPKIPNDIQRAENATQHTINMSIAKYYIPITFQIAREARLKCFHLLSCSGCTMLPCAGSSVLSTFQNTQTAPLTLSNKAVLNLYQSSVGRQCQLGYSNPTFAIS